MTDLLQWFATAATITAALMTASNLGARITGYGFAVFLIGSLAWLTAGAATGQSALMWTNIVLSLTNLFGIWRWLGRQAKVEEGGHEAAEVSERSPTPALFPVSLLTSATVRSGADDLGHCVDAMAGSGDGRLRYVVVSAGGMAGVGETLRRLDWVDARVEGEIVQTELDQVQFEKLAIIERDRWPAR